MPDIIVWSLGSVLAVSLLSLAGALTLTLKFLSKHVVLLALVAFAAGTLLGDAMIHLLPEAVEFRGGEFTTTLAILVLTGFLAFFLLETLLRWNHAHGEEAHPDPGAKRIAPFAWTNLVGDGIHNFIDGALIGTAYLVDVPLGIATTIAVAAHEIPQELGDFAVLIRAGLRPRRALFYNFLSALLAVAGTLLVLLAPISGEDLEAFAVPLIAGGFLYIAAADLIPELHHHAAQIRYTPVVFLGLVGGLAVMLGLLNLEVA